MGAVTLRELTKTFTGGTTAVDRVSLEIEDGEFLVLVGPSGCGKSTLLRMIAGIESVSSGELLINGSNATHALSRDRDIAMVFQNYALYPHMSVAENLEFGLKLRKVPKAERKERVGEVLRLLRLDDLEKRRPSQLSGGQRQRVAMGRAMVRKPTAYLMDEPLSNLDAKLRVAMRAELARLRDRLGVTTIYVTHDQTEALTLGDRVAVMRSGVLQQVDTPQDLFHKPRNLFVAAFIGSPTINLVEAVVDDGCLCFAEHRLPLPKDDELSQGQRVIVGLRPSDLEFAEFSDPDLPRVSVTVDVVEQLGSETHVLFGVDAPRVDSDTLGAEDGMTAGDDQLLADDGRSIFTAAVSPRRELTAGDRVELAVDTLRLYLFDPKTGLALRAGSGGPSPAPGPAAAHSRRG